MSSGSSRDSETKGSPPGQPKPVDRAEAPKATDSVENDPSCGHTKAGETYWSEEVEEEMEHAVKNVEREVREAEVEQKKKEKEKGGKGKL